MSKYPRLKAMGIQHPQQIDGYTISSVDYVDHLWITYTRPEGSLLPTSRSYRFPRVQKSLSAGQEKQPANVVLETDEVFREAVAELRELMAAKSQKQTAAEELLSAINALEEDINARTAALKKLAEKLKAG
jgi:hypothetical protein